MVSVINTIDTSHEDMIHDAQMDYYGQQLATCSSDRTVKVFEIKNGTQRLISTLQGWWSCTSLCEITETYLERWRGHEGPVWQIAWAHPKYERMLASCSYDRKVLIWKEQDGQWDKIYEYSDHESSVNSVCWAPHEHGLMLACGSSDGSISILKHKGENVWESTKINNAHSVGCNAVSWAPAVVPGSLIQPPPESGNQIKDKDIPKRIVSGGCDQLVKIWQESNGQWTEETRLESHTDWVRDCVWAPGIGLPENKIASCSQDGRVIIWTNESNNLHQWTQWTPTVIHKFDDVVWHVSWSLSGDILAVSCGSNKVSLWKESLDGEWTCISGVAKGQQNSEVAA